MKEPEYVMKIMASWMTIDELEGAKTRRSFIDSSEMNNTKQFTCPQPLGLHFKYRHQVDDHNNQRHAELSLYRIWRTKF